ncbi:sugar phosphate isomerase/epimerase [Rhodoblastus acidophilus]|uniref:sugar phosphate isomerase/epimerase family protein n=1 Tax=Rhodoblastus acidophilus TaxID=1074 RepID=UPI002224DEAD|nr:sugar phosphate isomerase/epimerase [Rhodoblastus acidophilus]MCW2284529.1 sugar phosphate isomerase/epimerase [Rhodoblastus acidophilus]MCW2333482.1 sugar phosphate isomerase/epimerase [Rhodoblastus acidophilus]
MRLAFSNLTLPAFDHLHFLPDLAAFGVQGIEIAPDHTFRRPHFGKDFCAREVATYGQTARLAGLQVVGLHALLGGRPELDIFGDADIRHHTISHLVHLSEVCRDLGGRTLILDSRWARDMTRKDAFWQCRAFLEKLLPRIEGHGTVLCLAPLAPEQGDFCRLAPELFMLANALDHQSLGLHVATAAFAANGETGHKNFAARRGRLDHVHIDEPGLVALGASGKVDHADVRRHLSAISYTGWCSVVQRLRSGLSPTDLVFRSVRGFKAIYRQDFRNRRTFHV